MFIVGGLFSGYAFLALSAFASGILLARLCAQDRFARVAWAVVCGAALQIIALWNLSWLGFSVEKIAWPVVLGLPAANILLSWILARRTRSFRDALPPQRKSRAYLVLIPLVTAVTWQAIPLIQSPGASTVLYSAAEVHTNAGLAEWFTRHSLQDDPKTTPEISSVAWAATRHLTFHLRVGQHLYHALAMVITGQSVASTWPMISAMFAAILSLGALGLTYQLTDGKSLAAVGVAFVLALHPLLHSAAHTSFISMAAGLAFLLAAVSIVFSASRADAGLTLAIPLACFALAMGLCYQETLPAFVFTSAAFAILTLLTSGAKSQPAKSVWTILILGGVLFALLSPPGLWWTITGLLRQTLNTAHGNPPLMQADILLGLISGGVALPGIERQVDLPLIETGLRWMSIVLLAGGLVASLGSPRSRLATLATLGSCGALLLFVLKRGGAPILIDYGISRALIYHGPLFVVLGLTGWFTVHPRLLRLAPLAVGSFAAILLALAPGYFSWMRLSQHRIALQEISDSPAWIRKVPWDGAILFHTENRKQLAQTIPYWRWLRGREVHDTFLPPAGWIGSAEKRNIPPKAWLGCFATSPQKKRPSASTLLDETSDWTFFAPTAPLLLKTFLLRDDQLARLKTVKPHAKLARLQQHYWLAHVDSTAAINLTLSSPEPCNGQIRIPNFPPLTFRLSAGEKLTIPVPPSNPRAITPISILPSSPSVQLSIAPDAKR